MDLVSAYVCVTRYLIGYESLRVPYLNQRLGNKHLPSFRCHERIISLLLNAIKRLLPFIITYLCESKFCSYMQSKCITTDLVNR